MCTLTAHVKSSSTTSIQSPVQNKFICPIPVCVTERGIPCQNNGRQQWSLTIPLIYYMLIGLLCNMGNQFIMAHGLNTTVAMELRRKVRSENGRCGHVMSLVLFFLFIL